MCNRTRCSTGLSVSTGVALRTSKMPYHDKNSPSDSPLLRADDTPTLRRRSELSDIDRDLGRADTNRETVDEAACNQHADVLRCTGDDGADDPDRAADLNGAATAELVGQITRCEGANEGATGHRSGNPTLHIGLGTAAKFVCWSKRRSCGSLVEVASILLSRQTVNCQSCGGSAASRDLHGAHGRDIEAKQSTANDGDGRDAIDVTDLIHLAPSRRWSVASRTSASTHNGTKRSFISLTGPSHTFRPAT